MLHDEFRVSLARQGISEEAYLKVVEKTAADLHADFKPRAEQRVKVLLVLTKIAETEGIAVDEAAVEAEVERGRRRYAGDAKLIRYLASERGRNFIRSTLRRTVVVERLVDDWLAAHPDHPALPHAEESSSAVDESALASAATDDAASTEPAATSEPTIAIEPTSTTEPAAIAAEETITEAGAPAGTGRAG